MKFDVVEYNRQEKRIFSKKIIDYIRNLFKVKGQKTEEIDELNLLYDRQLAELENKLAVKKKELNAMKNKLNNNT